MGKQKKPVPGGTYKSQDGNNYLVHFISTHTETGEVVVVYEELYGNNQIHHTPLETFMGKCNFTLIKHPALIPMD